MRLLVISHKESWPDSSSPTGYVTVGGFPMQMQALSHLFDQTRLLITERRSPRPVGTQLLTGHCLTVTPLPEPKGSDLRRKLALPGWLFRHLRTIWYAVHISDAVHALVPGDIGALGILVALAQRKPLFVRHCSTWGDHSTLANRVLSWLLPRVAGGRNVVMATGGGPTLPSPTFPAVQWIHSTTLSDAELAALPLAISWQPGLPLQLITVGRLFPAKNTMSLLKALPLIRAHHLQVHLHIVGDGEMRIALEDVADELGVAKYVEFHGNVDHATVMRLLTNAHLFLFPTCVKEGFPKAVLEALACGLPVVATPVSVIPHLIADCGIVIDEATPTAIAEAVIQLIEQPDQLPFMSKRARAVSKAYTLETWQMIVQQRLEIVWGPLCTKMTVS